ncbi:MAG: hypothetical protein JW900_14620 [Anaerolineae bacterium]|nr:hypothetical protein [Anaerolineae bacterium]
METLLEIIDRISFLASMPAIGGLLIALGILLLAKRWPLQVTGVAILYFFVGLLHTRVIRPEVALIKALIGWLICLTLYITGRHLDERRGDNEAAPEPAPTRRWLPPLADDTPLRLIVLLVAFVVAYAISTYLPLPQVAAHVGMACYLLAVAGLLLAGMSEDAIQVGMGLLVFLAGFDLFFGALEPSLAVAGLLGAAGFFITLAVTFMAVTHAVSGEEG